MTERSAGDRLGWAEIRQLALRHRRALFGANLLAVIATLCSVPIPLLLPLLVDEVLLGQGDAALRVMDRLLPADWQQAAGYIGLMLLATLLLRGAALAFNVLQARLFARLGKDVVYRLRQRLAIARMILAEPKLVILDEATSALDAATEYALHQALGSFLAGRTTLIIAHRLSAVKQADRVLVFDGGRIVEQGGHQQLIAEGGLYARLYGHLQR